MFTTKVTWVLLVVAILDMTLGHDYTKAAKYRQQRISNHMTVSNDEDSHNTFDTESQSALLQYQAQNTEGYYKFGYANPDGQYRVEEGSPDEGILGSYGYESTDGDDVKVYYRAGVHGFQIITADLYKTLLSERTKKLEIEIPPELTPTFEIEPYAEKVKPKSPEKPAPFSFVASRTRDRTTKKTITTTTTTSRPEIETIPNNQEEETHPDFNQLPQNNNNNNNVQQQQPPFPFAYPPYGNLPPWRFTNSLVPPLYNANGAIPPIPVYYSPQFGIQPVPHQMLPRFAPNMQLPLIIKV